MLLSLTLPLLALASSAQAAISLLYPNSQTIWYKNNTVTLNWTLTAPETDTYLFRALLSNKDDSVLSGQHSIADSTNATAQFVRLLLPNVSPAQGYVVQLVNTTNEAQVFATSDPFEIQEGAVATSTSPPNTATASSSGNGGDGGNIPNAASSSITGFPTSAATATQSGAALPGMVVMLDRTGLAGFAALGMTLIGSAMAVLL